MKRIGIGGLLVAAIVLASLSAVSVAAAAGGPEYLGCGKAAKVNKKFTGHYANKECSEVSGTNEGKYERGPGKIPDQDQRQVRTDDGLSLRSGNQQTSVRSPVRKGQGGRIDHRPARTDADVERVGLRDSERIPEPRKTQFAGPCNSPGQKATDIVSKPLATKLVWLNEAETEPGILVTPAEPGGVFEEVECFLGKVKIKQTGSILARIAPEGELTKLLTATFTASPLDRRTRTQQLLGRRDPDRSQAAQ